MKTLAKYRVCNHCVIGEKRLKIYLSGPVSYRDFRETGPWTFQKPRALIRENLQPVYCTAVSLGSNAEKEKQHRKKCADFSS